MAWLCVFLIPCVFCSLPLPCLPCSFVCLSVWAWPYSQLRHRPSCPLCSRPLFIHVNLTLFCYFVKNDILLMHMLLLKAVFPPPNRGHFALCLENPVGLINLQGRCEIPACPSYCGPLAQFHTVPGTNWFIYRIM